MKHHLSTEHFDQHHEQYQKEEEVALVSKYMVYLLQGDEICITENVIEETLCINMN